MIHVLKAEVENDYKIKLEFSNGSSGIIDFKKILEEDHREIIRELLDLQLFKTVKVHLNTLCWDNEVDFAPEYLHDQMESV